MLALDSTALNAASSSSSTSPAATGTAKSASSADSAELIQTIEMGIEAGDNSVVGSAMSELASISPVPRAQAF
jgi:hypothetical protein